MRSTSSASANTAPWCAPAPRPRLRGALTPVRACAQVEGELTQICTSILTLLDQNLIPSATTGESKARRVRQGSAATTASVARAAAAGG